MAATITLKNIPDELYEKLKERALRNHRSINREIISIFEVTLTPHPIDPDDFLTTALELRTETKKARLTQDFIHAAKREGRP
ncbi:MAG: Arc family DNA-binding protein [Candidatus Aminicenantes bacterium]|nr:Arc family DNA-binding protein [Candidatus Aminicenantes bacterium]